MEVNDHDHDYSLAANTPPQRLISNLALAYRKRPL